MTRYPLILAYHRIHPDSAGDSIVNTPHQLENHIKLLRILGYRFVSLIDWWNMKPSDSNHYAILTFDDGWADNFEFAMPILDIYKVPATIFLISNYIGSEIVPEGMVEHEGRSFLTLDNISEMKDKGIDFQSHTSNHKILTSLADDQIIEELVSSREQLGRILGSPPVAICYPKSKSNEKIFQLAKLSGYKLGVLTQAFSNFGVIPSQVMALPRIGLYSADSALRFGAKLFTRKVQCFLSKSYSRKFE